LFAFGPTEDLDHPDPVQSEMLGGKANFGVESAGKAILRRLNQQSLEQFHEDMRYN